MGRGFGWYSNATEPLSSVLIDPMTSPVRYLPGVTDEASIYAGLLVYLTAGSYPNDFTRCAALHGKIATHGKPYLVEAPDADIHMAYNYDFTTAYSDKDPIKILELFPKMWVWVKGSTITAALGETLVHAANGLVTNVGDPDGEVHAISCYAYKALMTVTSGTWVPVEVLGLTSIDNTA